MKKAIIMFLVKLRWAYFHIHPHYFKFTVNSEPHFQNVKTGRIHSNYVWVDSPESA